MATAEKTAAKAAPAKAAPAAKKTAAPAKAAAPAAKKAAKPAAGDAEDLLGTPAKKTAGKAAAKTPAEPKAKRVKEPVVFAEGERDELAGKIKKMVKKDINSKELATKLGIATRKLRPVLYTMQKANTIKLTLGASKVMGMTVSPAP